MFEGVDSTPGERAFALLLQESHLAPPDQLAAVVCRAVGELGGRDVELLIVDHGQTHLIPLTDDREPVPLEGTMVGRAFRLVEPQEQRTDDGVRLLMPVLDGIERLGVLAASFDAVDDELRDRCRGLASITAELLFTKAALGDSLQLAARTREMSLAAEMQWSLLPPLTAGTETLTVAAMLEPSYEVGGDLIDYAFDAHRVHLAVMDAMGHGLQASLLSALAIGAYRHARRSGRELPALAQAVEEAIGSQYSDGRFVTALFAWIDTSSGVLRWVNAGHPAPMLLREGRVVKQLEDRSGVPLGVGLNTGFAVHEEHLQPGDRLLLYTDGVIEARTPAGEQFGLERLVDFVVRADASSEPIPETMRRLSRAVLDHQQGKLRDDATQMLVEWRTGAGPDITRRFSS